MTPVTPTREHSRPVDLKDTFFLFFSVSPSATGHQVPQCHVLVTTRVLRGARAGVWVGGRGVIRVG